MKRTKDLAIGVVGLGYVGQPFVAAMAGAGYRVVGLDIDGERVAKLNLTYTSSMREPGLNDALQQHKDRINFTTSYEEMMAEVDAVFISVGTPLDLNGDPDTRAIDSCVDEIAPRLRQNQMITLRSTVIPGTTRRIAGVLENRSGLKLGTDLFVAFSPERTVSGKALDELGRLPVIVGATDEASREQCANLMSKLSDRVIRVPSAEVAEVAKLVDNMYRTLNIGFANELGRIAEAAGIDAYDVVAAVNTSYDRTSVFRPALGAEGPCLSKDPQILRYFASLYGTPTEILDAVVAVNSRATARIAVEAGGFIRRLGLNMPIVALLGLAFKGTPETDDVRGSPALSVMRDLEEEMGEGAVTFKLYDPVVDTFHGRRTEATLASAVEGANVIAVLNDHAEFRGLDAGVLAIQAGRPLQIIDAWHSLEGLETLAGEVGVETLRVGDGRR